MTVVLTILLAGVVTSLTMIFIWVYIHPPRNPLMGIECNTKDTSYDEKTACEIEHKLKKSRNTFLGITSSISRSTLDGRVFKTSRWDQVATLRIIVDNIHSYAHLLTTYAATELNLHWFGKWLPKNNAMWSFNELLWHSPGLIGYQWLKCLKRV